jgi:hypothetical protein
MPTPPEFMQRVGPASVTGPQGRKGTDQAWHVVQDIEDTMVLGKSNQQSPPIYAMSPRLGGGRLLLGLLQLPPYHPPPPHRHLECVSLNIRGCQFIRRGNCPDAMRPKKGTGQTLRATNNIIADGSTGRLHAGGSHAPPAGRTFMTGGALAPSAPAEHCSRVPRGGRHRKLPGIIIMLWWLRYRCHLETHGKAVSSCYRTGRRAGGAAPQFDRGGPVQISKRRRGILYKPMLWDHV